MVDIQTDPIKHQKVKKLRETNISNISVFDSKYRIGFEIPTPASPSFNPSIPETNEILFMSLLKPNWH